MKKERYEVTEMEIIRFCSEDMLITSTDEDETPPNTNNG